MFDLEEEAVPASKHTSSASVTSTSVNLPVILVLCRAEVLQVTLESVWRSYDESRGRYGDPNEANEETDADEVSFDELFENKLL